MRLTSGLCVTTLLAASMSVYAVAAPGSFVGSSSTFSIDHKTDVPGQTLKPGEYTIRVLDQLSDRMIVRVDSATGKDHAIFLGVPSLSIANGARAGVVSWGTSPKGSDVLRGFSFSAGSVEFVYPKNEAVALAKLNTAKVLALDPESEGMPALKNLSKDDMQIVNLWTLSLTTTGADKKPGIQAQHYQGDSANTALASTSVPAAPAAPSAQQAVATSTPVAQQPATVPQQTQVATLEQPQGSVSNLSETPAAKTRRPALAKLPKTASLMPLVWLLGFIAFLSAAFLRLGNKATLRA